MIRLGKLRDGSVGDAVGADETLTRLGREIEPLESLGEEEILEVSSKRRAVTMAHTVEESVAERIRLLGSGDQYGDMGVGHTKRPLDDPEDLHEATDKGDMDIRRVAQDVVQGKTKASLRGHREGTVY